MTNTTKNLLIALGIIIVVFGGYYLFIQGSPAFLRSADSDRQLEQLLAQTQVFVQHRKILETISLETSIIQSTEFRALRSYSPDPLSFEIGRSNPFLPVNPERPIGSSALNNTLPASQQ